MKAFVASRLPEEGVDVTLAEGQDGDVCVHLDPVRYPDGDLDLHWETNCQEWVDLWVIYDHFRRQETTVQDWEAPARVSGRNAVKHDKPRRGSVEDEQDATTVTVKNAARLLNCSISFVYKLMSQGELAYEHRGRRKLPSSASVAEYRQRNRVPAHPVPTRPVKPPSTSYQFKYLFQRKKVERKDER